MGRDLTQGKKKTEEWSPGQGQDECGSSSQSVWLQSGPAGLRRRMAGAEKTRKGCLGWMHDSEKKTMQFKWSRGSSVDKE